MENKKKFKYIPLSPKQSEAADPNKNIWVQANAGTGKTEVLTARILRILFRNSLYGTKYPGILCLTYTKVGASEMKDRIVESLRHWVMADDKNLKELLQDVTENAPTDDDVKRAREIFYQYIDNQDTIKIKTIHSFCTEILNRFSLEAGLGPAVTPIEGAAQKQVLERAFERLLEKVHGDIQIENAIDRILDFKSESFLPELYNILAKNYKTFFKIENIDEYRKVFSAVLRKKLRLDEFDTDENYRIRMKKCIAEAKKVMAETDKEDLRDICENIIISTTEYLENKISYSKYATCYTNIDKDKLVLLEGANVLQEETIAIGQNEPYLKNNDTYENTMALFDIMAKFSVIYKEIKREMNVIDYDDMILYTEKLFKDPANMGYVLSKLDDSLGHILVDEAQDTSADQWDIFESLSRDFIPDGEIQNEHSVFAVGDTKQSIYGFNDAAPDKFQKTKEKVKTLLNLKNRTLIDGKLEESFRSASPILNFVDYFFSHPKVVETTKFKNNKHKCFFTDRKGIIEFHPSISWQSMTKKKYAKFLADQIDRILKMDLKEKGEPIEPSDILILVRNRTGAMATIINNLTIELKKMKHNGVNIEVAGADSIFLSEFGPVIDLLNIIRFTINKYDDFILCSILKGPLYRFTEEEIQDLCLKKIAKNIKLYKLIAELAETDKKYEAIYKDLNNFASHASYESAYTFFTHILQDKKEGDMYDTRQKLISAYGKHIIDPLDDFISCCLSYERTQSGTMKDFLKWFMTSEIVVKRDFSKSNGINIITTHKSKGLTAPITMLIGTNDKIRDKDLLTIYNVVLEDYIPVTDITENMKAEFENYKFWLWTKETTEEIKPIYNLNREEAIKEHYRLLYVAMTRSKYGLFIYEYGNKQPDCWYKTLEEVFNDLGRKLPVINKEEGIKRIEKNETDRFFEEYFANR